MAVFLFARINSRNVHYWHKADMPSCTAHPAFGGKADIGFSSDNGVYRSQWGAPKQ